MPDDFSSSAGSAKLGPMILVFLASFVLYGLYCFATVSKVKVNGPFYARIVEGKDVIADVLPPPAYLVETYLTILQMKEDKDGKDLPGLEKNFTERKADYLARHAYWAEHLPEGDLREALLTASYAPALRMLSSAEQDYIPALKAGNRAKADSVLAVISRDYALHRAAIEKVVELARVENRDTEAGADVAVKSRTLGQIGLGLLLVGGLSFLSWRWTRA